MLSIEVVQGLGLLLGILTCLMVGTQVARRRVDEHTRVSSRHQKVQ